MAPGTVSGHVDQSYRYAPRVSLEIGLKLGLAWLLCVVVDDATLVFRVVVVVVQPRLISLLSLFGSSCQPPRR